MAVSEEQQYLIELINRARLDPSAEAARYGFSLGSISSSPVQVVAPNADLEAAATGHTNWMITNEFFTHITPPFITAEERIIAAGYAPSGFFWGEILGVVNAASLSSTTAVLDELHRLILLNTFDPDDRIAMFVPELEEVGIGLSMSSFTITSIQSTLGAGTAPQGQPFNAALVTQNYAVQNYLHPDTWVFLTGVAYDDNDNDGFYSLGEGRSNVIFDVGGNTDATGAAGGYGIGLTSAAGVNVTVTNGANVSTVLVDLSTGNVKLDLVDGDTFLTSGDLTLVSGVSKATLLGAGDLSLTGNSAANLLTGNKGINVIDGGQGDDTVHAAAGGDSVLGGDGADLLYGDAGFDTLDGGSGNDVLFGGAHADRLLGGLGDDVLWGEAGVDNLYGGDGNDRMFGGSQNDWMWGGTGADTMRGGSEADRLYGEDGNDLLFGEGGFDRLEGGAGNDTLHGGGQADNLLGQDGDDVLYGEDGLDRLFGGNGNDWLDGGNGTDGLFGEAGDDTIYGGANEDRVFGGSGNDLIDTGSENDTIYGGSGFDTIIGGSGDDTLWGNFNADTFVFADGFGVDVIMDFDALNVLEKIDLSGVTAIVDLADLMANHASQAGGNVLIDDLAGNTITLVGVNLGDLDASDFIF